MKIEENYWLLEVTGHHVLLEVIEICHEPFLLSPSENSLHTPSLKFRPESSNWSNYPNYFKLLLQLQKFYFLPQVTSQCTNPNFLKFFHIPSCSFPEAPQDTFKGRSSLQASFEPIPGITRHVWLCQQVLMREYKHIALRCWDSAVADKAQLTPCIIFWWWAYRPCLVLKNRTIFWMTKTLQQTQS